MSSDKTVHLRDYQKNAIGRIINAWEAHKHVLAVLPTGAGKTRIFSSLVADMACRTLVIAHRRELIGQISCALADCRVYHSIIGPLPMVKFVTRLHYGRVGRSFYTAQSEVMVASIDTLIQRLDKLKPWLNTVDLWVCDEAHHVLNNNKWGIALSECVNARGLGVTATAKRADGKGLGRDSHGLFDTLVIGPHMRELINNKYLCDYRVFGPRTEDLNLDNVPISKLTGDFNADKLRGAVRKSKIVGDVVTHYKRLADGLLGVTFVTDVDTGKSIADEYKSNGVPAEVVSHRTKDSDREAIIQKFANREILQLVNVDLFGEGFDLPAIECVSFARPTASYGLYVQQFGRALRLAKNKKCALIIDHVGNIIKHGLPDFGLKWTLSPRNARQKNDDNIIPVKACAMCTSVYARFYNACPFCGFKPVIQPQNRSIETVEGDLTEFTPEMLSALRGVVEKNMQTPTEYRQHLLRAHCPSIGIARNERIFKEDMKTRDELSLVIAQWAGYMRYRGYEDSYSYRKFYYMTGVDALTAQTLDRHETLRILEVLNDDIVRMGENLGNSRNCAERSG